MTFTASRPEIPGLDTGLSKPKPKKEKKQKQTPVELPKLDDTEFVPPPIAMRRSAACNIYDFVILLPRLLL